MSMKNFLAGLLFWTMALIGGAALAPCVILPAWIEYKAAVAERENVDRLEHELKDRHVRLEKQIDHQLNDPAYNERQWRIELGQLTPGVETIKLENEPRTASAGSPAAAGSSGAQSVPTALGDNATTRPVADLVQPELAAFVDQTLDRYPLARLLINDTMRPLIMIFGAGMLLA